MSRINPRPHKYRAKPTVVDGIRFASMKEAKRYGELKLLEKAGEIKCLEIQPKFDLLVTELSVGARLKRIAARMTNKNDPTKPVKIGSYIADFRYQERELRDSENDHWRVVVEDVKGMKTPVYRLKKRHVEAQYGIQIREV